MFIIFGVGNLRVLFVIRSSGIRNKVSVLFCGDSVLVVVGICLKG